jgi:hypothetical protein
MALPVTITGIATAVAPVGPFKQAATFSIVSVGAGTDAIGFAASTTRVSQSFTTPANAATVASVRTTLAKSGSPTDNLQMDIYATDGASKPVGSSLGTSATIAGASIASTATSYLFTFATPVAVSGSTQYAAVISRSGANDSGNSYQFVSAQTNVNSSEGLSRYNGSTLVWSAVVTQDLPLVVTMEVSSPAYYFIGVDGTTATTLRAYKTTNPTDTIYSIVQDLTTGDTLGSSSNSRLALCQTFTTGTSTAIKTVSFALGKFGAPTDNLQVEIWAVDGSNKPTGSALGTSVVIAGTTVSGITTRTPFTFTTPVSVSPSTKYAAVIRRSGALHANDYYGVYHSNTAPNVDAAQTSGILVGTTWTTSTTDYDLSVSDGVTWASIASKTGFTTGVQNISAYQDGNVIHMCITDGATTSINHKYQTFDMTTDTFVTAETINSALNTQTSASANAYGTAIVVRSAGEVVVHYQAARISTFAQTAYRRRTGVATWAAAVAVSTTGVNAINPFVVLGAADMLHLLWFNSTNTVQRHLTAANALGTAGSISGATATVQDVATLVATTPNFVGLTAAGAFRWTSGSNPTVTNAAVTLGTPVRAADVDGVFYALYRESADSDLYIKTSSDNGATWGSAVSAFVGTVGAFPNTLSINQSIYTRGGRKVFPYIVNDNGIQYYNEYTIPLPSVSDAWNANDKTATITLSNADKTATGTTGSSEGVHSTTVRMNGTAGKFYAEFLVQNSPANSQLGIHRKAQAPSNTNADVVSVTCQNGNIKVNATTVGFSTLSPITGNDVICVAWDAGAERAWMRKNGGSWNNNATHDPATGVGGWDASFAAAEDYALWANINTASHAFTIRAEVADLTLPVPSGFTSWLGELPNAWNVLDKINITLSSSDKNATVTTSTSTTGVRSSMPHVNASAGKYYVEFLINNGTANSIGLKASTTSLSDTGTNFFVATSAGTIFNTTTNVGSVGSALVATDVLCMAWDAGAKLGWFRKNGGLWNNTAGHDPATGVGGISITAIADAAKTHLWFYATTLNFSVSARTELAELTVGSYPGGFTTWMGESVGAAPVAKGEPPFSTPIRFWHGSRF